MPKVVVTNAKGLVQETGEGIEFRDGTPKLPATSITANTTLTKGGSYTPSGGVRTLTLPAAADVIGQMFVIRSASGHAHILTGSDSGVASFCPSGGPIPLANSDAFKAGGAAGKITFTATSGNSIVLISDGVQYLVMASSGSFTVSGYPN